MYVVSTKSNFKLEVINNDPTMVMVGVRINVGNQDLARAPGSIDIFGRNMKTPPLTRPRWFDFPLTREESLQCDKKLTITFGPSQDPEGVIMIDSVKVLVYEILICFIVKVNNLCIG